MLSRRVTPVCNQPKLQLRQLNMNITNSTIENIPAIVVGNGDEQMAPNSLSNSSEPSNSGYQVALSDGGEFMSDTDLNSRYNHPRRRWMHTSNDIGRQSKSNDNSENSLYSKASLPLTPFSNQVS